LEQAAPQRDTIDETAEPSPEPISPLEGEMSVQPTEGRELSAAPETDDQAESLPPAISPLEGEMPDRAEGGKASSTSELPVEAPILPKGFAAGRAAEAEPEAPKQK